MRVLVRLHRADARRSRSPACAEPPKLRYSISNCSIPALQGEVNGPQADEQDRLIRVSDQVRKALTQIRQFQFLDIAPVNAAAHASNLQACGGCDVRLCAEARGRSGHHRRGSKGLDLILNMNIYLRDVHTRAAHHRDERRFSRQYRRILVACDELSGAQPAARAELWRSRS